MGELDTKRMMGRWMTTAIVIGGMIGAGIVLLPVSLAPLGYNAVIGWLVSGSGVLALAYALAQTSRQDGLGIQAYLERLLGPTVAFAVTWSFWVSAWVANAAMGIAAAGALSLAIPGGLSDQSIAYFAIAMVIFLSAVNAFGARATGGTAILTVMIKILPLLGVVVIAVLRGASGRPFEAIAPLPITFDNVATASAFTLFALLGFENATAPVDKVRNPDRTIPFAILAGVCFVATLYLFCTTAISLIMPVDSVVGSRAPFATAIGAEWGAVPSLLAAFAMAVSAFGCLSAGIMIAGELGYSMALRGDLPSVLARADGRETPIVSQLAASALAIGLILANMNQSTVGLFNFLILLGTSATLWLYVAGAIAALRMGLPPLSKAVIGVGLLFAGFAFYGAGLEADLWSIVLIAIGLAVRAVMHRINSSPAISQVAVPAAPLE